MRWIVFLIALTLSGQSSMRRGPLAAAGGAKIGQTARQFNGTSQFLASASALNLAGSHVVTLSFFVYWNVFSGTDAMLGETSVNYNSNVGGMIMDWTLTGGKLNFNAVTAVGAPDTYFLTSFNAPSGAAWHHYLLVADLSAGPDVGKVYIDGSAASGLTVTDSGDNVAFGNYILYLFSRAGSANWGGGRISEIAIWKADESASAAALAAYGDPTAVDAGNLLYCWHINGTSPEPATVGAIALTVTGATVVSGPNP